MRRRERRVGEVRLGRGDGVDGIGGGCMVVLGEMCRGTSGMRMLVQMDGVVRTSGIPAAGTVGSAVEVEDGVDEDGDAGVEGAAMKTDRRRIMDGARTSLKIPQRRSTLQIPTSLLYPVRIITPLSPNLRNRACPA